MKNQRQVIIKCLRAMGGTASAKEVAIQAKQQFGCDIKACSTVMADMVLPENGGNRSSSIPSNERLLKRVSKGRYQLIA